MATLKRNLHLGRPEDQKEFLGLIEGQGIEFDPAAMQFAIGNLSDDWLDLRIGDFCLLVVGSNGQSHGLPLKDWLRLVTAAFELRRGRNVEKSIERLKIPSHEKLDTALVFGIALRFQRRGWTIQFEANGPESSDLLVHKDKRRIYVEVKRENVQTHDRFDRMRTVAALLSSTLEKSIGPLLRPRRQRIEIKLARLFSNELVPKLAYAIAAKTPLMKKGEELDLPELPGSRLAITDLDSSLCFREGIHIGLVIVQRAGHPVPASSSLSVCTFDLRPNFRAFRARIRKACTQLERDMALDKTAEGMYVTEMAFADADLVAKAIASEYWPSHLPRFIGVTLLGNNCWAIPRIGLDALGREILEIAATET